MQLTYRQTHYDGLLSGIAAKHVFDFLGKSSDNSKTRTKFWHQARNQQLAEWWINCFIYVFIYKKTIDSIFTSVSSSLIFDATTQHGMHGNCMIATMPSFSHLVSIERLPGRTEEDHRKHICESLQNLIEIHSVTPGVSVTSNH